MGEVLATRSAVAAVTLSTMAVSTVAVSAVALSAVALSAVAAVAAVAVSVVAQSAVDCAELISESWLTETGMIIGILAGDVADAVNSTSAVPAVAVRIRRVAAKTGVVARKAVVVGRRRLRCRFAAFGACLHRRRSRHQRRKCGGK